MTKKVKFSFLILVWGIVAVQLYVNYQDKIKADRVEQASEVVTAFSVTGDSTEGNVITGQGYFGNMEISQTIKKEMLTNLAQKLDILGGYSLRQNQNQGVEQLILTSESENTITNLRIVSKEEQNDIKQYIVIEVVVLNEEENIYDLYEKVEKIFEEIGVKGQVHMEMKVEKDGKRWKAEKS